MRILRCCACSLLFLLSLLEAGAQVEAWRSVHLTQVRREQHPCVYETPADVERARTNIQRWKWAKAEAAAILKTAEEWLRKPDEWFFAQLPAKGACFAYGFTGCPICSASWGTWGGARCSWDQPGKVTCANGHVLPDPDHPDTGVGYRAKDGRLHYFVGSYNAWVVETFEAGACANLALAYSLTGDSRYSHKAAVILDALASIYPGCVSGSWDYPSTPPSGRFSRPWYQVARVLVRYVDEYDQIFHTPALEEPSLVPGLARRQNVEENLLKNGAWYCYEQSLHGSLHNGEADYVRGALAVGCVLGIPQYVDWALDGPFGIRSCLANNVDRDGRYCETSMLYALHTRNLYLTFSEPLLNWLKPVNLYGDPKFKAFFTVPGLTANCLGHLVSYGDSAPDLALRSDPSRKAEDYQYAEVLYARATTAADKQAFGALVDYLADGDIEAARTRPADRQWLLFHAGEPPVSGGPLPASLERRLNRTDFLGREGVALLRAGRGPDAQALLLRYGQSLNHGHLDDLNLNYYALGREVTYDLGYNLGSTHTQVGWAHTTASHNLVVVNEKPQHGGPRAASGGSLRMLADTPLAQVVEAESANSYGKEGVSEYRRLCALIGEGKDRYLLDVFRVGGGSQHDYLFHCPSTNASFAGIALGPVERGSLAGLDIEWGNLQLGDGDMRGHPNRPYWNPPPGNGYGFLAGAQRARTDGPWTATWQLDARSALRLHLLGAPGTEVITATAPGLYPSLPRARYAIARRRGTNLSSTFIAVIEPFTLPQAAAASNVTNLAGLAEAQTFLESVEATEAGARVRLRNGCVDEIEFRGGFALRRTRDGKVLGRCRVEPKAWRGKVLAVDYERNVLTADAPLPADSSLVGQIICFSNGATSRNTPYRVSAIQRTGDLTEISLGQTSLLLGRGRVSGPPRDRHTLASLIPHEYARALQQRTPNGFFTGKLIRSPDGRKHAQVLDVIPGQPLLVKVDNGQPFEDGDDFLYCDVQPGDEWVVPLVRMQ